MKHGRTERLIGLIALCGLVLTAACTSWSSDVDTDRRASVSLGDDEGDDPDGTATDDNNRCECGVCDLDCPADHECYAECVLVDDPSNADPQGRFECQQRCIPAGACLQYDDCDEGEMCFFCKIVTVGEPGREWEEVDCEQEFGECVPDIPSVCEVDADCAATEWYMPEGGLCMSGQCVFEPGACDDAHACADGMECRFECYENRCEPGSSEEGSAADDSQCTNASGCNPVGYCVPPDMCLDSRDDCGEGKACQTCRWVDSDPDRGPLDIPYFDCTEFGVCMPLDVYTCSVDADCLSNGWQLMEVGTCMGGVCTYDPIACAPDAGHPCAAGEECWRNCFMQCAPGSEGDDQTATGPNGTDRPCELEEVCEPIGQCIPEGGCIYEHHCPEDLTCSGMGECVDPDDPRN